MIIKSAIRHRQIIFFAIIGVANTLVHGAILVVAVEYLRFDVTLSNALAFGVANVFSYFANSSITFNVAVSIPGYAKFLAASLLSLGITLIISFAADHYGFHYLVGFALIVVCVPLFSFFVMKFWAFSGRSQVAKRKTY